MTNGVPSCCDRLCFEPILDVLLVLSEPLDVGGGPLDGLLHRQTPRAEAHLRVISLELLELWRHVKDQLLFYCCTGVQIGSAAVLLPHRGSDSIDAHHAIQIMELTMYL